jgi:hypothetical protein
MWLVLSRLATMLHVIDQGPGFFGRWRLRERNVFWILGLNCCMFYDC